MQYRFPLTVGASWLGVYYFRDTTWVKSQTSITVPAGGFDNSFMLIKRRTPGFNYYVYDSIWFTPAVGVIRRKNFEYSLGPLPFNGLWELTEYHVSTQ
jgi:hypothetical protein